MGNSKNRCEKQKRAGCASFQESLLVRLYALRGGLMTKMVHTAHFRSHEVFRGDLIKFVEIIFRALIQCRLILF